MAIEKMPISEFVKELEAALVIIMEAPLHCDHRLSTEISCYEVSLVADSRRHREPRYFLVRNHYLVLYLFSKFAKSASEHYAHHRLVTVQP